MKKTLECYCVHMNFKQGYLIYLNMLYTIRYWDFNFITFSLDNCLGREFNDRTRGSTSWSNYVRGYLCFCLLSGQLQWRAATPEPTTGDAQCYMYTDCTRINILQYLLIRLFLREFFLFYFSLSASMETCWSGLPGFCNWIRSIFIWLTSMSGYWALFGGIV